MSWNVPGVPPKATPSIDADVSIKKMRSAVGVHSEALAVAAPILKKKSKKQGRIVQARLRRGCKCCVPCCNHKENAQMQSAVPVFKGVCDNMMVCEVKIRGGERF